MVRDRLLGPDCDSMSRRALQLVTCNIINSVMRLESLSWRRMMSNESIRWSYSELHSCILWYFALCPCNGNRVLRGTCDETLHQNPLIVCRLQVNLTAISQAEREMRGDEMTFLCTNIIAIAWLSATLFPGNWANDPNDSNDIERNKEARACCSTFYLMIRWRRKKSIPCLGIMDNYLPSFASEVKYNAFLK